MGFFGYISVSCPPVCGRASIKWHFSLSSPASNTVNRPTGPAPIISISVLIIDFIVNDVLLPFEKSSAKVVIHNDLCYGAGFGIVLCTASISLSQESSIAIAAESMFSFSCFILVAPIIVEVIHGLLLR